MVEAKEGNIDINFFKNFIQKKEEIEKRQINSCEINYVKYKIDYLTGWILKFFGYIKKDEYFHYFSGDKINRDDINNLPDQILDVPFIIIKKDKKMEMKFYVGFFGCEQNDKKEVSPVLGWIVSPSTFTINYDEDRQLKKELIDEDIKDDKDKKFFELFRNSKYIQ